MPYKVIWLRETSPIGTERFDQLDEAKSRAQAYLQRMRSNFGVTAVKVVDDSGAAHFLDSPGARQAGKSA